jgi:hypothetical protein
MSSFAEFDSYGCRLNQRAFVTINCTMIAGDNLRKKRERERDRERAR